MAKTVAILGAGFSRAISSHMPLTDELGNLVVDSLPVDIVRSLNPPVFTTSGVSFESWLSWLAERQPYETDSDFYERFSKFLILQEGIANAIRRRQALAEQTPLPPWIYEIIDFFHHGEATVITLNYDTLFESAYSKMYLTDKEGNETQRSDITKIFPRTIGISWEQRPVDPRAIGTLDLYKLHGSTDWYWYPGDTTGASLIDFEYPSIASDIEIKARRDANAGKTEFIVPPTSSKNEYFENRKTQYLWRRSYEAIKEAQLVILMGYSLPINDAALVSMLSRGLGASTASIIVVNPDARSVEKRLIALGIQKSRIRIFKDQDSIEHFVEGRIKFVSHWVAEEFKKIAKVRTRASVAIGWNEHHIASVVGSTFDSKTGTLTLQTSSLASVHDLSLPGRLSQNPNITISKTVAELVLSPELLNRVKRILVEIPGVGARSLGGFLENVPGIQNNEISISGDGSNTWIFLRPIGRIPIS